MTHSLLYAYYVNINLTSLNLLRVSWFLAWLTALLIGVILTVNTLGFQINFPLLFGIRIKPVATNLIPDPTIAVCPFYSFKPKALDDLEKYWPFILI